jgi:fatty acid desaturase
MKRHEEKGKKERKRFCFPLVVVVVVVVVVYFSVLVCLFCFLFHFTQLIHYYSLPSSSLSLKHNNPAILSSSPPRH